MKISAITPKPRLFESTLRKNPALNECYQAGRMLAELKMSEKEILDLFAKVEQGVTAAGNAPGGTSNRTLLGKAKDVPAAVMTSLAKFRDKISKNAYIQGVDQVFDRTTDALGKSALGKQAMPIIEKYRELSKQYPAAKSAITWGLIFLSGLASGGALAGPALIAGSKLLDGLLSGDKLSTAAMNAGAAGAASAAIGAIPGAVNNATDWVKGHVPDAVNNATNWVKGHLPTGGAPDGGAPTTPVPQGGGEPLAPGVPVTPQSQMNADDIANGSGGPDVPALDPEISAANAANAKAYGTDGADSTADMNNAILKTADTTNVADYGQLGAAGNGTEYTAVKGDTLSQIAEKNHVSVKELADANDIDIKDVHKLATGQQLTIPTATGSPVYDQGWGTAAGPTAAGPGPEQLSGPGVTPNTGGDAGVAAASNTNPKYSVGTPPQITPGSTLDNSQDYIDKMYSNSAGEVRPMGVQVGGSPVIPDKDLLPAQIKAVEANPGSFPQWIQDLYYQTINKSAPIAAPGNAMAESRRNMNNMLMEAIVATTNSIKPFKAKTINLSAMIDRQTTAHVWMLGESLGRNYKHRYHITEAGIDNIFKNVERYQRHIQIVVTESLLNEDTPPKLPGVAAADAPKTTPSVGPLLTKPVAPKPEKYDKNNPEHVARNDAWVAARRAEHAAKLAGGAPADAKPAGEAPAADAKPAGVGKSSTATADATASGPDRTNIPKELAPNMPGGSGTPQPEKPGMFRKAANWLGKAWAGAKNIGHQFTTKTTAEKLKMNWHVKGKPTESDEIATFLQGEGVPATVISDVFTQSKLPVPQAVTAAAAVPAPDAAAGGTATPAGGGAAAGGTATPAGGAAATPAGPGNPDTPAVAKAKAAMGIKPDTPAEAPAGATATDAVAGAATIPAGEKATTTTQVAEVKREMDQDIDDLVRSLRKLDNLVQPGYVEYIRNRLDQSFGKAKVASNKRRGAKPKNVTSPPVPVAESAPIYTAMSKRIPQSESRLTKRARNALDMFENFVEKTKAETKPLTESNTRPLIKRALTEQKAKQSIKITKKAVVQRNAVIDLWKRMPG